jgi:hypothetical protein
MTKKKQDEFSSLSIGSQMKIMALIAEAVFTKKFPKEKKPSKKKT